jgi:choloylglycine hydrolase
MTRLTIILIAASMVASAAANACTRVVYKGPGNHVITARSMDWSEDIMPNLWIFPRGMQRDGVAGPNSVKWTSKYGSVIASAYEISSTDGMNEKGLVANLLWLGESEYPVRDTKIPGLSIAAWVQYILDNFATVDEAVKASESNTYQIISDDVPGQNRLATLHLSISDPSGDNAVMEFIGGKLVIHHDPSYVVMTNSPIFEKQLALNEYWKEIGGTTMLPGTNRAADRFVRASFYIDAIPKSDNTRVAIASVFSVIRNCSVPYGISTPNQPNISSTRWRAVSDQKELVYYFETALTPNTFWVTFKDIDFSPDSGTRKLSLLNGETYAGNAVKSFVKATPFKFLGI